MSQNAMPNDMLEIGIITDEVSRDLGEALELCAAWSLSRFELREGSEHRFPFFTNEEVRLVEEALRDGARVTAVSPGIMKGHVDDAQRLNYELDEVLPETFDVAARFDCPLLVVFGFERRPDEPAANRLAAMRAFEEVAERASDAGLAVAIENEPNFWVDRPQETAALLDEIGHPNLGVNWDPANQHWGGFRPDRKGFEALRPHLLNVHVKDYMPDDPDVPWRPLGDGVTPWPKIVEWLARESDLEHLTVETHCPPWIENSRRSVETLRALLDDAVDG